MLLRELGHSRFISMATQHRRNMSASWLLVPFNRRYGRCAVLLAPTIWRLTINPALRFPAAAWRTEPPARFPTTPSASDAGREQVELAPADRRLGKMAVEEAKSARKDDGSGQRIVKNGQLMMALHGPVLVCGQHGRNAGRRQGCKTCRAPGAHSPRLSLRRRGGGWRRVRRAAGGAGNAGAAVDVDARHCVLCAAGDADARRPDSLPPARR